MHPPEKAQPSSLRLPRLGPRHRLRSLSSCWGWSGSSRSRPFLLAPRTARLVNTAGCQGLGLSCTRCRAASQAPALAMPFEAPGAPRHR